jgi:Beta protein
MLGLVRDAHYFPILKFRNGELRAIKTAHVSARMIPVFLMPKAGDFDHQRLRPLSPTEHIRGVGARLRDAFLGPVFIDAVEIDDEAHREGLSHHPLTELLERARLKGALAFPVTAMDRAAEYQDAVRRFVRRDPRRPVCLRVAPGHLESQNFGDDLLKVIVDLGCYPSRVLLLIDFGALHIDDPASFVEVLSSRLNELPRIYDWLNVVISLSSFPAKIPGKENSSWTYPRGDIAVFKQIIAGSGEFLRVPMFSDYAVDTSPLGKPPKGPVSPSTQFRYTTPENYIIEKGRRVKKPVGYDAIWPVAKKLAESPDFAGRDYSEGDAFINELAHPLCSKTGNASTWRWAATDHHLTSVGRTLQGLLHLPSDTTVPSLDVQLALF